jgi:hypothetical protein
MELATVHFDTYKAMTLLKEKGFNKKQSEGIVEVMQQVALSGVATKQDVQDIRTELRDVRQDMQELEIRLSDKITKGLSDNLKFQIIQTITMVGVMVALFQIF